MSQIDNRPKETSKAFKRYQFGDELGKGAFGRVFRGLNITTGEVVAIKQIEKDKIKDSLPAVMRELELLQKLDHPNIVKFVEYIDTPDHLYFTLEFVEGGSLYATMKRFGSFPESLLVIYITQVLRGLQYLHTKGVIHRDIKAANILLTKEGQCKLADFGNCTYEALSKGVAQNITSNSTNEKEASSPSEKDKEKEKEESKEDQSTPIPCGFAAPFWMAPELVQEHDAVYASDIWSLGCTLLELLTGKPPYSDLSPEEAIKKILEDERPPFPSSLSPDLEEFLGSCFVRDPGQRPTAEKLLQKPWVSKLWGGSSESSSKDVSATPKDKGKRKSLKIHKTLEWTFKLPGLSPSSSSGSSAAAAASSSASAASSTNSIKSPRADGDVIIRDSTTSAPSTTAMSSSPSSNSVISTSVSVTGSTSSTQTNSSKDNQTNSTGQTTSGTTAPTSAEVASSEKEGMMQNILELTEQLGKETDEKKTLQKSVEELRSRIEKLSTEKETMQINLKDLRAQVSTEQKIILEELRELLQKLNTNDSAPVDTSEEREGWLNSGTRCVATNPKHGQSEDAIVSSSQPTEPGHIRVIFIGFGDEVELPISSVKPYEDAKKKKTGEKYRIWGRKK